MIHLFIIFRSIFLHYNFVGWMEARPDNVQFRTSTQPKLLPLSDYQHIAEIQQSSADDCKHYQLKIQFFRASASFYDKPSPVRNGKPPLKVFLH